MFLALLLDTRSGTGGTPKVESADDLLVPLMKKVFGIEHGDWLSVEIFSF